jgi:hypothetical protein
MRTGLVRIAIVILAVVSLAGCESPDAPPGTPGSAAVSLHGRMETGFGTTIR